MINFPLDIYQIFTLICETAKSSRRPTLQSPLTSVIHDMIPVQRRIEQKKKPSRLLCVSTTSHRKNPKNANRKTMNKKKRLLHHPLDNMYKRDLGRAKRTAPFLKLECLCSIAVCVLNLFDWCLVLAFPGPQVLGRLQIPPADSQ